MAIADVADQAPACAAGRQAVTPAFGLGMQELEPRIPDVRLFVGGHGHRFGALEGDRCYSPAHPVNTTNPMHPERITALLDSGAFSDRPEARLSPAAALARQLTWERNTAKKWSAPCWQASYLVSYDRLIDETWVAGQRHKRRWSAREAERAVEETVAAAGYLARQRATLAPRQLVLATQGVDALQYAACVQAVLAYATPDDWIGLGGWCILGRWRSWLPTFWATLREILPKIAAAGLRHVHLFGVLWLPALGGLLWLADRHGLTISTDSSAPTRSASVTTAEKRRKAGARAETWQGNVQWWVNTLATLRSSAHYHEPPRVPAMRQLTLL